MASRSFHSAMPALGAVIALLALTACGSAPDAANWLIAFPGGTAPTGTVSVYTEIRTGGCAGAVRFRDDVAMGERMGMSPGALPEGRYGFYAEARDGGCAPLATGCVDVQLPVTGSITVMLSASAGAPACPASMCAAGVCGSALPMDLGVDFGVDMGPLDLGPPDDLGPPVPCATEGAACGMGATAGICHGMNCCAGCWDGTACRAGTADLACGDVGAACASCTPSQMCSAGTCELRASGVEPRVLALSTRNSFLLTPAGAFASAGDNLFQLRGMPRNASPNGWSFETYTGGTAFVAVAATQFTGYGINAAGQLYAWGSNTSGLLGVGSGVATMAMPAPARVGTDLWRTVDGGNQHVCAIRQDGRLACWGDRTDGRIGEGATTGSASAPVVVGSANWLTISAGERHTCGIQVGGTLWCWGYNSTGTGGPTLTSGQLGVGDTDPRDVPTRVGTDSDWQSVSAGTAHTCAIKTSGTLWCWGEQANWGRLGLGPTDPGTDVLTPQQVTAPGLSWTVVAAGNFHTCGIAGGDLYCWGLGLRGATGSGTTATDTSPVRSVTGYSDVAVSADHSCGRAVSGDYFCWGRVADARSGTGVDPTGSDLLVPTLVMIF